VPVLSPNSGVVAKLRWALDLRYHNLHGLQITASDREEVARTIPKYDLVWMLNSRTANILGLDTWKRAHLDIDDVPSTYLKGVAQSEPGTVRRLKLGIQQRLLRRRELRLASRFTTLSVCSDEDRRYLKGDDRMHVIPNGFARPKQDPVRDLAHPPRIGFVGLYSYAPNSDGVRWFLSQCWPILQERIPGIRFRLVGKETDGPDAPRMPGVDNLGWVDNPAAEMATWSAMVIPIRFGGGTRIKIADGFSRKCPIVSTTLGAFGYGAVDGRQLRLADDPKAFAQACVDLIERPDEGAAIAERAWSEFLEKWTWDAIAPRVERAAEDCLSRSRADRLAPAHA
jgi:glycosyltransferase involved in cell wall biosynthesis